MNRGRLALAAAILAFSFQARAQTPAPAGTSPGPRLMFENMGVVERDQMMDAMAKKEPTTIFHAWIDAGRVDHDPMEQLLIGRALSGALRQRPMSPELHDRLQTFIASNSNSFNERGHLLLVIGDAEPGESLDLLRPER